MQDTFSFFSFIHLFNHALYLYGLIDTYFILCVYINAILFNLLLKLIQLWPLGDLSVSSFDTLTHPIILFLNTSLVSDITRYFRVIWYISFLSPRISSFSKEPCFLLLENGIVNQNLGPGYAHCHWGVSIISRSSQWTKQGNVSVYTNLCIHSYV